MKQDEMVKCKKCGGKGHVVSIKGLTYAQCTNCTKWDPFQFLGVNANGAIHEWNIYNSTGKIMEESYD